MRTGMVVSSIHDDKLLIMKTKTKQKTKKYEKSHTTSPGKAQDRGLNQDEQNKITNVEAEDDDRYQKFPQNDVEAEEERERRRKIEDARGIENES